MATELSGYERFEFSNSGFSHSVYVRGQGPGVVLMHELPGMTPACVDFAERIVSRKYRVYMPLLFGGANRRAAPFCNAVHICISREIRLFSGGQTSPIVDWLRALCRRAKDECGGPGIGVIGMCLTGNFAIALMAEDSVLAPVASQPALPTRLWGDGRELGISPEDLAAVKARAERCNISLLGFRFEGDCISRQGKFERLKEELGSHFSPNPLPGKGHSVFTRDFVNKDGHPTQQAQETLLQFLNQRLHLITP